MQINAECGDCRKSEANVTPEFGCIAMVQLLLENYLGSLLV